MKISARCSPIYAGLITAAAHAQPALEAEVLEADRDATRGASPVVEPAQTPPSPAQLRVPTRAAPRGVADLFGAHSWYEPPTLAPAQPDIAPRAPTAPPLPYRFLGSYTQGEETVYFVVRGERLYDLRVGDVVDSTYSVDGVRNDELLFTYLPLTTTQRLKLGETQ